MIQYGALETHQLPTTALLRASKNGAVEQGTKPGVKAVFPW